jgi:hypothetical protein
MSKENNGGPAFPKQEINQHYANEPVHDGMSLRDYFAAKAVQSMINDYDDAFTVKQAYKIADLMLEEMEK